MRKIQELINELQEVMLENGIVSIHVKAPTEPKKESKIKEADERHESIKLPTGSKKVSKSTNKRCKDPVKVIVDLLDKRFALEDNKDYIRDNLFISMQIARAGDGIYDLDECVQYANQYGKTLPYEVFRKVTHEMEESGSRDFKAIASKMLGFDFSICPSDPWRTEFLLLNATGEEESVSENLFNLTGVRLPLGAIRENWSRLCEWNVTIPLTSNMRRGLVSSLKTTIEEVTEMAIRYQNSAEYPV